MLVQLRGEMVGSQDLLGNELGVDSLEAVVAVASAGC